MAFEYIDQLSERLQKLSNGELDALASLRAPASVPAPAKPTEVKTVPGVTVQETSVVEAPARVRPLEIQEEKPQLTQTGSYMDNVNRALEQRDTDKKEAAQNALDAYEKQKQAEISLMQAVEDMKKSREPYKTPDWLNEKINQAKEKSENLEKAPERNLMSEAILAFAPGLAAALTGSESMALAAPKAQEQGRNLYEVYRKEELDQIEKRNKAIKDKYENLAKLDKAYADRWLGEQKLAAEQAKAVIEGLKLPLQVNQKDSQEFMNQYNKIAEQQTKNIMEGAGKVADLETLPMKEQGKSNRAKIIASGQNLKEASALRKEFESLPDVKQFRDIESSYAKIESVAKNPSPAGDISLVFSYMKMLDPGSTVREGEYATARNAASVPDIIRNQYNKIVDGTFLTEKQRMDFLNQARNIYNSQQSLVAKREQNYGLLAQNYGAREQNVLPGKTKQAPKSLSSEDKAALEWAKKNPKDPRAKRILNHIGGE